MSETRKLAAKKPGGENARVRVRVLVRLRLAGLSALEVHYAVVNAHAQMGAARRLGGRALAPVAPRAATEPSLIYELAVAKAEHGERVAAEVMPAVGA